MFHFTHLTLQQDQTICTSGYDTDSYTAIRFFRYKVLESNDQDFQETIQKIWSRSEVTKAVSDFMTTYDKNSKPSVVWTSIGPVTGITDTIGICNDKNVSVWDELPVEVDNVAVRSVNKLSQDIFAIMFIGDKSAALIRFKTIHPDQLSNIYKWPSGSLSLGCAFLIPDSSSLSTNEQPITFEKARRLVSEWKAFSSLSTATTTEAGSELPIPLPQTNSQPAPPIQQPQSAPNFFSDLWDWGSAILSNIWNCIVGLFCLEA